MGTAEKVAMGIVTIALVTTLVLPGRLTPQVFGVVFQGFNNAVKTAMGR